MNIPNGGFSVLDSVAVLNEESDYTKVRNYWKYFKSKLRKENSQLVSDTTRLKLTAADGKSIKLICWIAKELYYYSKISPIIKQLSFWIGSYTAILVLMDKVKESLNVI
jgi:cell filamentation protein